MTQEERELLAADYVLGTLDAEERATASRLIESDPAFVAAIRAWEDRLAPLDLDTAAQSPPANFFARIEAELDAGARPILQANAGVYSGERSPAVDPNARLVDSGGPARIVDLTRRIAWWRTVAATATAFAAGLAAIVVIDRLPSPSRGDVGRYLAVVNTDGTLPAMIVDVDTARGLVTVRSLAAEQPAGRNLELWAIPEGEQPVSLGVVDPADQVVQIRPDQAFVIPTRGMFAVSVEPIGGSPTGAPTGPVVYSGALVPAVD